VVTVWPSLPAGILANVSYDPFERGIDVPVATMNYNAIRYRFLGRVRVFIDGMIFPAGLAAAGLLLMSVQGRLELRAIAAFGLALSLVLFVLHWNIGKEYVRGLIEMLRDGAVELDAVASGLRVPPEHVEEIRAMLAGDPRTALMGLQMAARCEGEIPPAEISMGLAKIPMAQAREVLAQFAASGKPASRAMLEALAETAPPEVRQLACERIFCSADPAIADRIFESFEFSKDDGATRPRARERDVKMIAAGRGGIRCRSIVRNPITKRVLLSLKLAGVRLLRRKL